MDASYPEKGDEMARLHDVLEAEGKPVRKGDTAVIYFPPTGVGGGSPTFPVSQGTVVRADSDALVNHIAGLRVVK